MVLGYGVVVSGMLENNIWLFGRMLKEVNLVLRLLIFMYVEGD